MKIDTVKTCDIEAWLALVREVEPLFGPMIGTDGFQEHLAAVIGEASAFAIRNDRGDLCGVVAVSREKNEIEWLAVASRDRQRGLGEKLLAHAIQMLDAQRPITVQTFAEDVPAGRSARTLYRKFAFQEIGPAGLNPAGLPTVILERAATNHSMEV